MSFDNNKNNKGCGCHNNPSPELPEVADMSMNVCDRNLNMLPMLQTYTTKVLKPNVHCKKNILTQQMMNCEGYKYVIKWNFDLNGQTITVPNNCILEFDGGSLKNGTIIGQDTVFINVGDVDIWGEGLTREGTWREHSGGGSSIEVDDHLDEESENPVQNKVVTLALGKKAGKEKVDDIERINSELVSNIATLNSRVATDESNINSNRVTLQSSIEAESQTRANNDGILDARITAEAEARQIKDGALDDSIESLQNGLNNRYTKQEVNAIISNTPETDVVVVQGQAGVDPTTLLPAVGTANIVYRIMAADGSSFSEYSWNGSGYVLLANHNTGVDPIPKGGSSKLVTSDGVAKSVDICNIINGTIRWPNEPLGVCTWHIPVNGRTKFMVSTNRPVDANHIYLYSVAVSDDENNAYTFYRFGNDMSHIVYYKYSWQGSKLQNQIIDITGVQNAKTIGISINERNLTTGVDTPLRVEDFEGYYIKISEAEDYVESLRKDGECAIGRGTFTGVRASNYVVTSFIPVENNDFVRIINNKPLRENSIYQYYWMGITTNAYDYKTAYIDTDTSGDYPRNPNAYEELLDENVICLKEELTRTNCDILDLREHKNVKAVACVIRERNILTDTNNTLSALDFSNYSVRIQRSKSADNIDRPISIRNGSVNNVANTYCVSTEFVRIGNSKFISVVTNRPNSENCQYRYGWGLIDLQSALNTCYNYRDSDLTAYSVVITPQSKNTLDVSDYPNAIGIAFSIAEVNIKTGAYNPLRFTDFIGYDVRIVESSICEDAVLNLINGDSVVKCTLQNGSAGNAKNLSAVSNIMVPTLGYESFEIKTTRPNAVGYHYVYTFTFSKYSEGSCAWETNDSPNINDRIRYSDAQANSPKIFRIYPEERGIAFGIWEKSNADGSLHPLRISDFDGYDTYIIRSGVFNNNSIVAYNIDKEPILVAACRHKFTNDHLTNIQDLQFLIVTDSHSDTPLVENAIDATNGFTTIDAIIHCGDVVNDYMPVNNPNYSVWKNAVAKCNKPFYCVVGNHDVSQYASIWTTPTDEELYLAFVKPSVDAGHLRIGEYTENKCYYYHDFRDRNVRLIVLDEFETPLILDESTWQAIPYNAELPKITRGTTYNTGAEVNDLYYTGSSFRAVKTVTTSTNTTSEDGGGMPRYKYPRGRRWFSQQQAQWFLDTLLSTPANYQVVVATHCPYSVNAGVIQTSKFSQKGIFEDGYPADYFMIENDFIADALNAFQSGVNFTTTCVSKHPEDIPSFTVAANFSNKNIGVRLSCIIGGHVHRDLLWKHKVYNQYGVTPILAATHWPPYTNPSDIRRPWYVYSRYKSTDCLTVVSCRNDSIVLTKIGVDITEDLEKRDYERIITI